MEQETKQTVDSNNVERLQWQLAGNIADENGDWLICDNSNLYSIIAKGNPKENAELICKAVNNYSKLKEINKELIETLMEIAFHYELFKQTKNQAALTMCAKARKVLADIESKGVSLNSLTV